MEIRVYTKDLKRAGQIENQTSLLWRRKYFEAGEFELHVPVTADNMKLMVRTNIITLAGYDECGVIEDVSIDESPEENEIVASGRFAVKYLDQRVVAGVNNLNGTVEASMQQLFNAVSPFTTIEFGEVLSSGTRNVEGQFTNKNLLSCFEKLARYGLVGYKLTPDYKNHKWKLVIFEGIDRSESQKINNRVIFSEKYDNLNEVKYQINDQSYYNVAIVEGKDENENSVIEIVGDTDLADIERRELFVDGSNISPQDITAAEFRKALRQEGQNTLNLNQLSETFECNTNTTGNFNYREHYDLGDVVTVFKKSWGIKRHLRITEIEEVYERDSMSITPTFGTPLPTSIDWED